MSDICKEVGSRIRYWRKAQGYTLTSFARVVHRSKSTVSKYERGEISIDISALSEVADALGVRVEQLLGDRQPRQLRAMPGTADEAGGEDPGSLERFYVYLYAAHFGRPLLSHNAMFLGESTAAIYAEIPNDSDIYAYKSFYKGHVRRSGSFVRVMVVNPVQEDDIAILEYQPALKTMQIFTGFFSTFSVGSYYPMSTKALISTVPINDEEWIKAQLILSSADCRTYRSQNGFFCRTELLESVENRTP